MLYKNAKYTQKVVETIVSILVANNATSLGEQY